LSEAGTGAGPALAVPIARVEHRLPGRVRLRVTARRGDTGYFVRAVARLRALPGVRAARANPRTGSFLVEHEGDDAGPVAEAAEREGLFRVEAAPPPTARATYQMLGAALAPDPVSLVTAGLTALAAYQAVKGQAVGSATESFWNAYGAYARHGRPGLALGLAAAGVYRLVRGPRLGSAAALLYYALGARDLAAPRAVRPPAGRA
jgi:hypothetical protein